MTHQAPLRIELLEKVFTRKMGPIINLARECHLTVFLISQKYKFIFSSPVFVYKCKAENYIHSMYS